MYFESPTDSRCLQATISYGCSQYATTQPVEGSATNMSDLAPLHMSLDNMQSKRPSQTSSRPHDAARDVRPLEYQASIQSEKLQEQDDAAPPGVAEPTLPAAARLPIEIPPPPKRPDNLQDALMDDALRSLPPAAHRHRHTQRRPSPATVITMFNTPIFGPGPASAQAGPSPIVYPPSAPTSTLLQRTATSASGGSVVSVSAGSQNSASRSRSNALKAAFTRVANFATPSSPTQLPTPTTPRIKANPPMYPSSSVQKTKDARRAARREARKAERLARRRRNAEPDLADDEHDHPDNATRAAQLGGEIVELPAEPPLDVPEANAPTASALAMASKVSRKPKRKLQFAPDQRRIRKVDLPSNFEAEDIYRNLDQYVAASRQRRRTQRQRPGAKARRSRSRRGSRSSRGGSRSSALGSAASESSSGSSSSSSSLSSSGSSSSSSSGSGRGITIARLRAFFGDGSSSSSSSDSDDSSTGSSSSSSSSSTSSRSQSTTTDGSRSRRSSVRRLSLPSKRAKSRRSARSRSRADPSEASDVPGSPVSSRKGPMTPYFAPLADFPLGKRAAERRQNKKAKQAAKRAKKREAQLIRQGRLPPKPSRSARAKALRAKELAGGVTEYQLFTPMRLPMDLACTTLSTLEATPEPQLGSSFVLKRTMRTRGWDQIRNQLYVMRNYLRQIDGQGGDVGLDPQAAYPTLHRHHRHAAKAVADKAQRHPHKKSHAKDLKKTRINDAAPEAAQEELDFFDGDLALPPPALDLPVDSPEPDTSVTNANDVGFATESKQHSLPDEKQRSYFDYDQDLPADQEEETRTGRHLSDMPLSPNYATIFGRDFGRASTMFSKNREAKKEAGIHSTPLPPSVGKESSQSSQASAGKPPTDGNPGKSTAPATTMDHSDQGAWWLHVHCPTYRDMYEISKLFPMHPLTVEDVLQQDPREKVDVFDRLGYYFVVIRAIDERYFRYTSASSKGSPESPSFSGSSDATVHGDAEAKTKRSVDKGQASREEGAEMHEMRDLSDKASPNGGDPPLKRHQDDGHNTRLAAPARLGKGRVEIVEGIGGKEGLEGVSVGGNNLYLLVFSHGVISFTFEDVSKHIDRVAARLLEITRPVELTADWIAHDLYDSVVDAFFPLISFVQAEVVEVEALASEPASSTSIRKKTNFAPKQRRQRALLGSNPQGRLISVEPVFASSSPTSSEVEKRTPMLEVRRLKTVRALRPLPVLRLPDGILDRMPHFLVKQKQKVTISRLPEWEFKDALETEMRRTAAEIDEASNSVFDTQAAADQSIMLHRIADTRKIVTGLSRLLAPKHDAVKGLRKRLADMQQLQRRDEALHRIGGSARSMLARTEVSMYMSDVHDHIISMLNQLNSGEGRLSEIHHTYLAQITIENRRFRQGADSAIFTLASVALAVLIIVFITSIFSVNVTRPGNELKSNRHAWFIGIACVAACVPPVLYLYVRRLYKQSKRKVADRSAAR